MLKIETINEFLGFGEGTKRGEYYFSVGMGHKRGGIEPSWYIAKSSDSSTISASLGYGLVQEFTERLEGSDTYNYAVDEDGVVAKCQMLLNTWARLHIPGTSSHGNGLITDHSSSQRVLYIQDEYVGSYDGTVWYDTFMDLGWSLNIRKSPDIYEDYVVIPNGSTVALLNITDDSKNYAAFTLPANFECIVARAGRNGVLLGANFNNRGVLVLWDCESDRSIAPWLWLGNKVEGITKYNGIWLVATKREIILTNGYSILKKYPYPDTRETGHNIAPYLPSGIKVDENKLLIAASQAYLNRRKLGVFILDFTTELWEFAALSTGCLYSSFINDIGAIFINSYHRRLVSYGDTFNSPNQDYIGRIFEAGSSSYFIREVGARDNKKKKAEAIVLNLGFPLGDYESKDSADWDITVKLHNFSRLLWGYAQTKAASSNVNELIVNDDTFNLNAQVGDEVTILQGLNAGEVRHIGSISGPSGTQVWTLDADLSYLTETTAMLNVASFKKVGEKTLTTYEIHEDRLFIPIKRPMIGRKFLAKVYCGNAAMRPHISSLAFIYDDLGL